MGTKVWLKLYLIKLTTILNLDVNKITTKLLYKKLLKKLFENNELASNTAKTMLENFTFLVESRGILHTQSIKNYMNMHV